MSTKVANYKLKRSALAAVGLLLLISLLGIYTALFIEIPQGEGWSFMSSSLILLAHAVLGTLLIFHALSIVMMARKTKSALWMGISVVALVGILVSVGTGSSFISADNDWLTFIMSLGFTLSTFAYVYGIYADPQ